MSQQSTFKVSHASKPLVQSDQRLLEPRTDIDMPWQQRRMRMEKTFRRSNEVASDGPHDLSSHGLSTWDHRAMLIQLLHESRRFQAEQLKKHDLNIDQCCSRDPTCTALLTREVMQHILYSIHALMTPLMPRDNYGMLLQNLWSCGLFHSSLFFPEKQSEISFEEDEVWSVSSECSCSSATSSCPVDEEILLAFF